jgi:hypothetical protein
MLYIAMIPVFIYYLGRHYDFERAWFCTITLGALCIELVQYVSAFMLMRRYAAYKPLVYYMAIASLIIILEFNVWSLMPDAFDESQFYLLNIILGISGLMLGIFYIGICRKIASR